MALLEVPESELMSYLPCMHVYIELYIQSALVVVTVETVHYQCSEILDPSPRIDCNESRLMYTYLL